MKRRTAIRARQYPRPPAPAPAPPSGPAGWRSRAMAPLRTSGRVFFCSDGPEVPPGYYRFVAPDAKAPVGPFATATDAQQARQEPQERQGRPAAATLPASPSAPACGPPGRRSGHSGVKGGRR